MRGVSCKLFLGADNEKASLGMKVQSKERGRGTLSAPDIWVVYGWRLQGTKRCLASEGSPGWCPGELGLLSAFVQGVLTLSVHSSSVIHCHGLWGLICRSADLQLHIKEMCFEPTTTVLH